MVAVVDRDMSLLTLSREKGKRTSPADCKTWEIVSIFQKLLTNNWYSLLFQLAAADLVNNSELRSICDDSRSKGGP